MKSTILLLLTLSLFTTTFAQDVKIIRQTDKTFPKEKADAPFYFLEPGIDTTTLTYIATLEITSAEMPAVETVYDNAHDQARKLGANAFRIKNFTADYRHMILDIYQADADAIEKNKSLKPRNTVYIFAGEKKEPKEYYTFELNSTIKSIRNGTYIKYELKEGEQVKLKKGTLTGTTMWVKWREDQLPNYYSIHGFYKQPVVKRTAVSEPFKPGKFLPVDSNLGAFLAAVLSQKTD